MSCTFSFYRNCGRGRDCSQERQRSNLKSTPACEPQTYFRSSLLALRKERSNDRKYVCGSPATIKEPIVCAKFHLLLYKPRAKLLSIQENVIPFSN